jgi:hypothetical protein
MGLFFEKKESTKPFIIIRILMISIFTVIVLTILMSIPFTQNDVYQEPMFGNNGY